MLGGAMNETPTTNNKPSAGAIRAAEIIVKSLNAKGGDILITSFAVVIDRETRAPELLSTLDKCVGYLADLNGCDWITGSGPGEEDMKMRAKYLQSAAYEQVKTAKEGRA